ncbi:MAG: VWA domain-containing protein [Microlunatus sp.]
MSDRPLTRLVAVLCAGATALALLLPTAPAKADPQPADNKLMLVMDSSGSMKEKLPGGTSKIAAAKSALDTVIDGLPESQLVGLRVYGAKVFDRKDKGACTDSQRVVDLGTGNRGDLRAAVKKYQPYGETPIGYALQEAGKDLGQDGQRTIVLVSDGEPTCKPDPCEVAADLAEQGIDLKIEVVGLDVAGKARAILKCIADKGRGNYYDATDAAGLVRALETISTRAARPYQAIGKPITGAESAAAPTTITPGDWTDSLGGVGKKRSELYYLVRRTSPKSTIRVSASLVNDSADPSVADGIDITAWNPYDQDLDCGHDYESWSANFYGPVISTTLGMPGIHDSDEGCTDNDAFLVVIKRYKAGRKSTVPIEIRVSEEPLADNVDQLPEPKDPPAYTPVTIGRPTAVVGGSSFDEALPLKPGSYQGSIVPGESQIFRVPVGWGQSLRTRLLVDKQRGALGKLLDRSSLNLIMVTYSPGRGNALYPPQSKHHSVYVDKAEAHGVTNPVVYRGRSSYSDPEKVNSQAGDYYVVVSAIDTKAKVSYQLPFTLGVAVDGKVTGAPEITASSTTAPVSPSSVATPSPSDPVSPVPSQDPSMSAAPSSDEVKPPLRRSVGLVLGGIGLVAVLVGGAALTIHLVRRKGSTAR